MLRRHIYLTLLFVLSLSISIPAFSQSDEGFIYGKITSISDAEYQGQIRWGKEEAFWNDIFNATKTSESESTYKKYAQEKKNKNWWENLDGGILKIWDDEYSSQTHQFTCRFGDIKSLSPQGEGRVVCEFKNGLSMSLKGGSNDFGTTIVINDFELGIVKMRWSKIKKIEFKDTPEKLENKLGASLFGEVKTTNEQLTGFIQWDKDERLDSDLLEGSSSSEKLAIAFKKIACIENLGNKSMVKIKNNKSIVMHGTNDVNSENRGIVVSIDGIGKVEIPWSSFSSVCFDDNNNDSGPAYKTYNNPQRLFGMVKDLNGTEFNGLIIFDKDEKWDFEQLEGLHNEHKYIIPFKNIKTIVPKNEDYTYVILRNEKKLLLGKLQDVSSKNEGVVIISSNSDANFIDWQEVDEINFE